MAVGNYKNNLASRLKTPHDCQRLMEATTSQPIVLTCAQPNSHLHLGNYLGAIQRWVAYQEGHICFFGLVDLHSITIFQKPAELRQNTLSCLAQYIACGLDPKKSHLFLQSQVIGHTELAWILGCMTPVGQLQRMTQFKDKSARQDSVGEFIGSGLLFYPVLMAADILLYNADIVPVGDDQKQHLELTRDLAERFNATYSPTFKVPEVAIGKNVARIMSLQDPAKKMSKSDPDPKGTLFLLDKPDVLKKKIMSAVTDTEAEVVAREDKPGITNLLNIFSALSHEPIKTLEAQFAGQGYGTFKAALAECVIESLRPIRERYEALMADKDYLLSVFKEGKDAAQARAHKTLDKVYRKVGFLQDK